VLVNGKRQAIPQQHMGDGIILVEGLVRLTRVQNRLTWICISERQYAFLY
jgi:hypothetical protein